MQYTLIKDNIIENIIVCEPEILPTLDLPYDSFIEWKIWHEIGVEVIDGEYFKYTKDEEGNTITSKFNTETNLWAVVE